MPIIRIRGQDVNVDIESELQRFSWDKPRWTSDKLIAASPFRYDRSPSFFVNLDGEYAGTWGDSGAYDAEWERGNFVKLYAFLNDISYEEAADELISLYGDIRVETVKLDVHKKFTTESLRRPLPLDTLKEYRFRHPYLAKRGISEEVQRSMKIGYDKRSQAITIPWFDGNKGLITVKYRKVYSKVFWYIKGGVPVRNCVYGINRIYEDRATTAVICEAEIDAMSWWTVGIPAVAVGGSNFTKSQADIIKRSPIEELAICTDNDKAGEKLANQISDKLKGYVGLSKITIPSEYKDVNEAHVNMEIGNFYNGKDSNATTFSLFHNFSTK